MLQKIDNIPLEKEETPSQDWEGVFQLSTSELLLKEKMKILSILVESNEIIPFETFMFHSNNFCLYFKTWMLSNYLQNTEIFQTFKSNNLILFNDICSLLDIFEEEQKWYLHGLQENARNIRKIKKDAFLFHFFKLFYKAYLELKKLWATNGDLLWFNA